MQGANPRPITGNCSATPREGSVVPSICSFSNKRKKSREFSQRRSSGVSIIRFSTLSAVSTAAQAATTTNYCFLLRNHQQLEQVRRKKKKEEGNYRRKEGNSVAHGHFHYPQTSRKRGNAQKGGEENDNKKNVETNVVRKRKRNLKQRSSLWCLYDACVYVCVYRPLSLRYRSSEKMTLTSFMRSEDEFSWSYSE